MGGVGRAGDGRISLRLVRIDSSIDRNRFLTIPASILIDTAYLESLPSLPPLHIVPHDCQPLFFLLLPQIPQTRVLLESSTGDGLAWIYT